MQLSIIVPFYNSSNFLANCLNSFKKINKETEIILINDGSSDNPDKIINAFKRNKNYNIKYISLFHVKLFPNTKITKNNI